MRIMATKNADKTTLDDDVTKPSVTAPGDGPADTTDPEERAVSVTSQPGDEAIKVGTVNAVKPAPKKAQSTTQAKARVEEYEAVKPDGTKITVEHDLVTGATRIK